MYLQRFSRLPVQHVKFILFGQVCNPVLASKIFRRQLSYLSKKILPFTSQQKTRLYSNDGDSILESESFDEHTHEESMHDFSFKKILYLEDDPQIKSMNACHSAHELLQLCAAESDNFQTKHHIQAIILLWDFCRKTDIHSAELQDSVKCHPAFKAVLQRLSESPCINNSNESTCCYLYVKRIGLDPNHQLLQKLLQDILDTIKKDNNIPLSALSRFSVAVSIDKNFNAPLVCRDMMPHILKSLQACTTGEELRLITICLANIRHLVTSEDLDIYKAKITELIAIGKINTESTKCILRVLNFLIHPVWSHKNSTLSRQLMILLLPSVDNMHENEVKAVFKIFQSQLEPAAIAPKLLRVSEKLLERCPTPEILACVVQFVEPKKREHLIDLFKNCMANKVMWQQPSADLHFFTILRALKISDNSLCDTYWTMVLNEIESNPDGKEHYVFSRHCHRYMYFNNNLGGTYRHIEFEKRLVWLCMNEIKTGISGVIPSKFANLAPFIIGYGHTYRENIKLPNVIVSKIETMSSQFTVLDCLQISRGIQIALEMRFRHFIPNTLKTQLAILQSLLSECTQRHLKELNENDTNDLNSIVRALSNRKASRKSAIYKEALNKYNEVKASTLNSRLLRNMSFNLSTSNFVAPQIIETMFDYIVKHEEYVTGDTVEKILSCSYNLGYSPQCLEGLYSSATIVMRDFNYMTGLSIIQSCLALCFYKTIPEQLINKVFCVDFIKRIEEEIVVCYSKATYPERVLNQVMQLNRAVCLDFPEADVPWFQQNYLEAQLSKYPFVQNKYSEDVKQVLMSVLKNESLFRCNHVTPYGYRIDFVIHFDKQLQAIPAPTETTVLDKITKVALLLLKLDSLCEKDLDTLRGKEALKMRHLEMLGYKVVHINEYEWKHLKLQNNKTNYLKCLLQISS